MLARAVRSTLLLSALCGFAAVAQSDDTAPPVPVTKNTVQFDAKSPSSPAVSTLKATGTVTPDVAGGWTCTGVTLTVTDANGNAVDTANGNPQAPLWKWSYQNDIFTSKATYKIKVVATFTKGTQTDTKTVEASLTCK